MGQDGGEGTLGEGLSDGNLAVVGVGASAGGMEALRRFFEGLPADTGLAFVVVQHLDPGSKSVLVELLARHTTMPVAFAHDNLLPRADHVYVCPPNRNLALLDAGLVLVEPAHPAGLPLPIDYFFRSLAADRGERAVGVVLSGAGSDGAQGLVAIKEHGGLVLAQKPSSAGHGSMPQSAVDTGLVDFVLLPEDMGPRLLGYVEHRYVRAPATLLDPSTEDEDWLSKIFVLLRECCGHDFSRYKRKTVARSIARRMALQQLDSLPALYRRLRSHPSEVHTLFRELLIGVTRFFRDADAYAALDTRVLPRLFEDRKQEEDIRVWVPGCGTGEEAYSIAMLLREHQARAARNVRVQVFATDINGDAIQRARAGRYPASVAGDVGPERLERFFVADGDSYAVNEQTRGMVLFAVQSIIRDPPFSRLDLLSCRNVLIYLDRVLQKQVMMGFHYALKPGGFLFLGSAESPDEFPHLFAPVERQQRLFAKTGQARFAALSAAQPAWMGQRSVRGRPVDAVTQPSLREAVERRLLQEAPACVVVHASGELLFVHGRTGKYLELPPGQGLSANALEMAREGLRVPLGSVIHQVGVRSERVVCDNVRVKTNGDTQALRLVASPGPLPETVLVRFEEATAGAALAADPLSADADARQATEEQRAARQDEELRAMREYLQSTIEELGVANEELRSTNEELQSSNEELETSREELQSVNEELVTLNGEHEAKIEQLTRIRNDLGNALIQVDIGIIFLDRQLCVRQFNPAATLVSHLRPADIGRPLSDIAARIDYPDMVADAQRVFDTLVPRQVEVRTAAERWYSMHIRPYRTVDNLIDGVTLTFHDVSVRKWAEQRLDAERGALTRVHQLCSRAEAGDTSAELLQAAVDSAVEICGADMGCLHALDDDQTTLRLLAWRDLPGPVLGPWAVLEPEQGGGLRVALRRGERVIVEDVEESSLYRGAPELQALRAAGVRALQCAPLRTRGGRQLGVLSTFWAAPHCAPTTTLLLMDLLQREAAELIDHRGRDTEPRGETEPCEQTSSAGEPPGASAPTQAEAGAERTQAEPGEDDPHGSR